MSQLEVDKIVPQSGTTLTIGDSGDTITIASGATLSGSLNADNLDSGTVPDARITGAYTGITSLTMSGDLTVDTNTLFVDASANTVGIGTNTPNYLLDVEGTGAQFRINSTSGDAHIQLKVPDTTSNEYINFGDSTSINTGQIIYRNASDSMAFSTNGSEAIRIDSSGNLGLGTTAPSQKLDVVGSIEVSDGIYIGGTGTANKLDDYEEGTWTPQITDTSGNNATMGNISANFGKYTKIGNTVFVTARVNVASNTGLTGSNRADLSGLPFTGPDQRSTGNVNFHDFSLPSGASSVYLYFEASTDKFQMYVERTASTPTSLTVSQLGTTNSSFGFSATYITD